MRFDTLDAFVKHLFDNKLNINDVEMDIGEGAVDPVATPDVIAEPPVEEVEPQGKIIEETVVIKLASGDITLPKQADGSILVDDYYIEENVCGTGFVVLEGRKLHLMMCDMDGNTVVYLPTAESNNTSFSVHKKK